MTIVHLDPMQALAALVCHLRGDCVCPVAGKTIDAGPQQEMRSGIQSRENRS